MANLFPVEIIKAAQECQRQTRVPACLSLAQWALESGYGHSMPAAFNYFGIKWVPSCPYPFKERLTKEQRADGSEYTISAKFVEFPDLVSAFRYRGRMLANPKGLYKKALPYIADWLAYLKIIAPIYASDKNYVSKIVSIVRANKLDQYNNLLLTKIRPVA